MMRNSNFGGAMAEFTVVVPVMLLILFGTVQWGFLMLANVSLRNAAEVGARAFVLGDGTVSEDEAEAAAVNACNAPLKKNLCVASAAKVGDVFEVTVAYNMDIFFSLAVPGTVNGKFPLQAKAVMQ